MYLGLGFVFEYVFSVCRNTIQHRQNWTDMKISIKMMKKEKLGQYLDKNERNQEAGVCVCVSFSMS